MDDGNKDRAHPCIFYLHLTEVPATAATKVVLHWAKIGCLGVVVAHVVAISAAAATTATYDKDICITQSTTYRTQWF